MDSKSDIERIAFNILKESKSLGKFPTQVDKIVQYSELDHDKSIDLSKIHPGFVTKNIELLKKAIRKVRGAIDIREKTIYIDLSVNENRQRFIKLHETGHKLLPWQKNCYEFLDDDNTLSPSADELFENEANYFASSTLFQLDRFEEEASLLPLSIKSAMVLAHKFGSSKHAALRRYVEYSNKRCALIVLENFDNLRSIATIRNYFQSPGFTKEFGILQWPNICDIKFPFIVNISEGRRFLDDGSIYYNLYNKSVSLNYHYFNNSFNYFIFLFPPGEFNKSKTKILIKK